MNGRKEDDMTDLEKKKIYKIAEKLGKGEILCQLSEECSELIQACLKYNRATKGLTPKTKEEVCVIDLDTVMPGSMLYDFGDSIRFGSNTCAEDEKDLSKVKLDMAKYESFTKGFMSAVGKTLTENEKQTMALGAITMTIECGLRFLTDFIDGDKYFKTEYSEHNLVRARCQLALAKDMLTKYEEMKKIVSKYC